MKRMHLKRKRKLRLSSLNKVILIIIMIIISLIYIFSMFNKRAIPVFKRYSEIEVKKMATTVINDSITEKITSEFKEDLLITNKDSNGKISNLYLDSKKVNNILTKVSKSLELNLKKLKSGKNPYIDGETKKLKKGIVYELPSGVLFNNSLFNNILPKVPVRLSIVGNIITKLENEVKPYGINNSLIEIYVKAEVELKVILPFSTSIIKVESKVPLVVKITEGEVPNYYYNGYLNTPSVITNIK